VHELGKRRVDDQAAPLTETQAEVDVVEGDREIRSRNPQLPRTDPFRAIRQAPVTAEQFRVTTAIDM